jgi:hypothetical protein
MYKAFKQKDFIPGTLYKVKSPRVGIWSGDPRLDNDGWFGDVALGLFIDFNEIILYVGPCNNLINRAGARLHKILYKTEIYHIIEDNLNQTLEKF